MIITIASETDLIGKSILAVNLAVLRAKDGCKTLLIDASTNKSSFIWSIRRSNARMKLKVPVLPIISENLYDELQDLGPSSRDIVIDAGKTNCLHIKTALIASQAVIVPIQPHQGELKSQETLIKCIDAAKPFNPTLRTLVVITRAPDSLSAQDYAAAQAFAERIPTGSLAGTILRDCSSIHRAFEQGLSVVEYTPAAQFPAAEMERLYQEVYKVQAVAPKAAEGFDAIGWPLRQLHGSGGLQRH